jgi:prepilin-type N-terminal cleavage/methylation domain-containing protein
MNELKKNYKFGFTLVELLVVIAIIAILASISVKAASVMNERTAAAITSERLAEISNCLAEFYAEFGQYPPSTSVEYTDWSEGAKPANFWTALVPEKRGEDDTFAQDDKDGLPYHFRHVLDPQTWNQFKDNVGLHRYDVLETTDISGDVSYTNRVYHLRDGWDQNFRYNCKEPCASYELYSVGSSGSEKDDIYAGQKY